MRDIAFDIRARDKTQGAFDAAERNVREFGNVVDSTGRSMFETARAADKLAAAQGRVAASGKLMSANDNWQRRNLQMQMMDVTQMLALGQNPMTTLLQQGPQIAQIYGPGEGGVTRVFKEMGSMVLGAVTKFPLLTAAAAVAGIGLAGMTHEINQMGGATVTMGDVALGVFQSIGDTLYSVLQPAIAAVAPWFATAWDMIKTGAKFTINYLIGGFLTVSDAIGSSVMGLPDVFIMAGEAAANGFLSAMEEMVQEAVAMINGLVAKINGALRAGGIDTQLGDLGNPNAIGFGRVDIGGGAARDRLGARWDGFKGRASDSMNRDYAGEFFDDVRARAQANALKRVGEEADKAGGKMKKAANDNKDPWAGLRKVTEENAGALERQQQAMEQFGSAAGGILKGLADGTLSWKDALLQAGQAALEALNAMSMAQGGKGLFGGGFVQGLIGSLIGGGMSSPAASFAGGAGTAGGFASQASAPMLEAAQAMTSVQHIEVTSNVTSRFLADGGFDSAVDSRARPIARQESAAVGKKVVKSVPSIAADAQDTQRYRRLRPGGM